MVRKFERSPMYLTLKERKNRCNPVNNVKEYFAYDFKSRKYYNKVSIYNDYFNFVAKVARAYKPI